MISGSKIQKPRMNSLDHTIDDRTNSHSPSSPNVRRCTPRTLSGGPTRMMPMVAITSPPESDRRRAHLPAVELVQPALRVERPARRRDVVGELRHEPVAQRLLDQRAHD